MNIYAIGSASAGILLEAQASNQQAAIPELYAIPGQPCFFTMRAWGSTSPFANKTHARVVVDCLLEQRAKSGCRIDVFCVMPNHVHVVVTPAVAGASSLTFIDRFKGWSSREVRRAGWRDKVWQPRSYDHLIRQDEDLDAIAAYILGNPVRAKLCSSPDDYPWSGVPEPIAFT